MVFNKEPILALYDILSDLANEIPIYKELMDEDEDSTPDSYVILVPRVTDSTHAFGDGKTLIRNAECDINLISKGSATTVNSLHNINKRKIIDLLNRKEINFTQLNLGYDSATKTSEYSFSIMVDYIG